MRLSYVDSLGMFVLVVAGHGRLAVLCVKVGTPFVKQWVELVVVL